MPDLVRTEFRDLLVSSDILITTSSFCKIFSTCFSWLTAKIKIPSFFILIISDLSALFRELSILIK